MTEPKPTYDAGQPSNRLAQIRASAARGEFVAPVNVLWLVREIERLQKQVTQLADALEAATRPLMDEKTQDILSGFMDSIKHPPGSKSMFDAEGE